MIADDEITEVIPDVERRMREQYEASVAQDSAFWTVVREELQVLERELGTLADSD